jgi:hypothetical protein
LLRRKCNTGSNFTGSVAIAKAIHCSDSASPQNCS